MTFLEAKAVVEGGEPSPILAKAVKAPRTRQAPARPAGWQDFAGRVVSEAMAELWSDRGRDALCYLRGRGLTDETIRAAKLGARAEDSYVDGVFPDKPVWVPAGVTIPWYEGDQIVMVNIRRRDGSEPKYWALRGSYRGGAYPSKSVVKTGQPLAIVEGEFESLLLGQLLSGLLPVVSFGSAGDRPTGRALDALLGASPWLIALDADDAGERATQGWLDRSDRCRRIRPPYSKDWSEVAAAGVNLKRWWADSLAGIDRPALFTADELSGWRWGPAANDPTPGIDSRGRFDPATFARAMGDEADGYALVERDAIRCENG